MFPALVKQNLPMLRAVLRNSEDEASTRHGGLRDRLCAGSESVVNDLQYALRDADPGVRVNAARSLVAFAVAGIKVEPTWFIEMLNSLSWTDRTRALAALDVLTDARYKGSDRPRRWSKSACAHCRRWSRWRDGKRWSMRLPAYILLGRSRAFRINRSTMPGRAETAKR